MLGKGLQYPPGSMSRVCILFSEAIIQAGIRGIHWGNVPVNTHLVNMVRRFSTCDPWGFFMGTGIWKIPFPLLYVKIFYVLSFVFTMEFLKFQYPMQSHTGNGTTTGQSIIPSMSFGQNKLGQTLA